MSVVLIVEDTEFEAERIVNVLSEKGHEAHKIVRDQFEDAGDAAEEWLKQHASEKTPVDVLVLDIKFKNSGFGGTFIYEHLIRKGLRRHWKHTIVCSVWKDLEGTQMSETVKVFLLNTFIPEENWIPKNTKSNERLIARIDGLIRGSEEPTIVKLERW